MGHSPGDEPVTLTKCHSFMKPRKGGNHLCSCPQLLGIKRKMSFFISFNFANLLVLISWHDACQPHGVGNWLKYNK